MFHLTLGHLWFLSQGKCQVWEAHGVYKGRQLEQERGSMAGVIVAKRELGGRPESCYQTSEGELVTWIKPGLPILMNI